MGGVSLEGVLFCFVLFCFMASMLASVRVIVLLDLQSHVDDDYYYDDVTLWKLFEVLIVA